MRAIAVFPTARDVRLVEHAPPELTGPTQVKLRMLEVGVCGTDREICALRVRHAARGQRLPRASATSRSARCVEVGARGDRASQAGDLVVPMVRRPCAHDDCLACRAGRQDFCFTGDFTERGIKGAHGFMTELVVDDEALHERRAARAARRRPSWSSR